MCRALPQGYCMGIRLRWSITNRDRSPEQAIISIAYVVQGYRYIELPSNMTTRDLGSSGSCQVNVNCSEGQS